MIFSLVAFSKIFLVTLSVSKQSKPSYVSSRSSSFPRTISFLIGSTTSSQKGILLVTKIFIYYLTLVLSELLNPLDHYLPKTISLPNQHHSIHEQGYLLNRQ